MLIQPDWPVPASIKAFTTTRLSDIDQINVPSEPCRLKQVHGARVIALTDWQPEVEADASFTREKGKVCVVKTADCLPILLADKNATVVAAIHAGWRSLAHGIIDNTIVALNVDLASLYAWFGPAISQQHFEVGEDVLSAFQENQFDTKKHFKQTAKNKWHADLYGLAKQRLNQLGVTHIYGGEYCTYSQPALFYSYRRGKESGRLLSLIWID